MEGSQHSPCMATPQLWRAENPEKGRASSPGLLWRVQELAGQGAVHSCCCVWVPFLRCRLRIPLSVQSSRPEAAARLQRDWLALLERHCQPGSAATPGGSQGCSSPEADYEEFIVPVDEQREETPSFGGNSARSSLSKPAAALAEPAEGQAAPALPPALGRAEVPPAPPALPQPCSAPPAAKRTKAFHWDVVPCDKIQKSVWGSCDPCKRKIDVCRLCEQFQIQDTAVLLGSEPPVNQHILLDRKVAHNF
ncbi:uncharacterized protein LOC120502859, partial [Passer montanus]|uniref:uncharacterized protein LOC120502859 n=1 Tax=Passer montanus TaxID=9160 RepID=UPI00195F5236